MQLPKLALLRLLLLTILSISITSCTSVTIKDEKFCGDLGYEGAHCNHTLVDKPEELTKTQWDTQRFGWICEDSQAFTDWKTIIQQMCDAHQDECNYEALQSFFIRAEDVMSSVRKP